ncbi:MAG TPA: response regulator transcription factor [Nitriliruptorales bacterium]
MADTDRKARVLVVDDEPDIRRIVRLLLERDGSFEVVGEAADGADGLEFAQELEPDVVLLDLMMPKMSGREALPLLGKHVPRAMIVVLSALDEDSEGDPTRALGAFGYIEKTALGETFAADVAWLHKEFQRALDGETVVAPASAEATSA